MDNAKYHIKLSDYVPRKKTKKIDMMQYLDDHKVEYDDQESKTMI